MTTHPYPATGYTRLPWKNGSGQTDEICLLPDGASRERFEIRVSSAPILERGVFSSFPGADRVITLIEGQGLSLEFADETLTLAPFEPQRFDSRRAPMGTPQGGPVRVVNLMADRAHWSIDEARVLRGEERLDPGAGGRVFVIALNGACAVAAGGAQIALDPFDSALVEGPATLSPARVDGTTARGIAYLLSPAG